MTIFDKIIGRRRVLIKEDERALHLWKGQIQGILTPGEHWLADRKQRCEVEIHNLARPQFVSAYEKALFDKVPDVAMKHLTVVTTTASQVAVIENNGKVFDTMGPDSRFVAWKDAGPWTFQIFDLSEGFTIDAALAKRIGLNRKSEHVSVYSVGEGQVGLLFVDGAFERKLEAGIHAFWSAGRMFQLKLVDLKRQTHDVSGQEVLTKDRVTLRVNITADYQVVDPVKAVMEVKDFSAALYLSLQLAFRKSLGAMTLDQVLAQKVSVDAEAADKVRKDMAAIGIEVSEIAIKDVILPGDMRDILNQVVAAEKEAEANVIRRREETNATRSLLNTAKVMADNPVMLRLKELEALEVVAGQVDSITVHSGTDGLMNDLVKLRG